jgi:hypothetical protein
VSGNYFSMFGWRPFGRLRTPADDARGAAPVAVLNYKTRRDRYGADLGILGREGYNRRNRVHHHRHRAAPTFRQYTAAEAGRISGFPSRPSQPHVRHHRCSTIGPITGFMS